MQIGNMTGKVALVTGAASGLGRATARKLAEAGADLAIVDIDAGGLAETAGMLPGRVLECVVDLSNGAACEPLVADVVAHFGRLDALCNVAGLIQLAHSHEMPPAQYQRTIDVNLSAPFLLSRAAIPHLLAAEGAIVNVASIASFVGEAYAAAYCASKWGLLGLTKAMAMEYIRRPIRINAVAPGGMMTNIATNFRPPEGCDIDLIKRYSPLRGLVEVDDVAAMVAHLASPAGRGFHGACITLDAGQTAG
jgi:NAD(P)-dependent dehydrogenase (short-subunit alcohol dehydrogenase family)